MEIQLTPELEDRLYQVASHLGRDSSALVVEAVERLVDYDTWFLAEVEKGLVQIDTGQTLSHEEVGNRLQRLLASKRSAA
jgi:predicted transcriptional regulator